MGKRRREKRKAGQRWFWHFHCSVAGLARWCWPFAGPGSLCQGSRFGIFWNLRILLTYTFQGPGASAVREPAFYTKGRRREQWRVNFLMAKSRDQMLGKSPCPWLWDSFWKSTGRGWSVLSWIMVGTRVPFTEGDLLWVPQSWLRMVPPSPFRTSSAMVNRSFLSWCP